MDQLKTRIFERAMRMRRGVLIKSEKSSANTETGEDGRAVPAATKGAIDVDSVLGDVEGSDSFFDKDRDMDHLAHGDRELPLPRSLSRSQGEVLHAGRQTRAAAGLQGLELAHPRLVIPDLVVAALADEHHRALDVRELAQLRGEQ